MAHVTTPRHRILIAVTAAWAVLLVVVAVYAARHGAPTVRGQSSVAEALPTLDRAIADVAVAAEPAVAAAPAGSGPAAPVPEISGYQEVSRSCSITAVRSGARYERTIHLYVPEGQEPALLDRIRAGLPDRYAAETTLNHRKLTADAGNFVVLRGAVGGPGEVTLNADTGCRPLTRPVTEKQPPSSAASRAPAETVLATLRVSGATWRTHRVDCPRGGSVWTVEADGPAGSAPASLVDALRAAAPAAVAARPALYAYWSGPVGVVVRTHDGIVTVTATTGCGRQ
jgi:hypothetical protein